MLKRVFQLLLITVVFTVLFIVTNAVLPFSPAFVEMTAGIDSTASLVFSLIQNLFICFTIALIARHSSWRGAKRFFGIAAVLFMETMFMSQIETMLFGSAFPALTNVDVVMIMLAQLPSFFVATLLAIRFFGQKGAASNENAAPPLSAYLPRIAILSVIFLAVYYAFGFIVIWQSEEARAFYMMDGGDAAGFGTLADLGVSDILFYPLQIVRGMMFVGFLLPVVYMLRHKSKRFVTAVCCLVYFCTPVMLIAPNPLMPDYMRLLHFIEVSSSMLLFGVIAGLVLYAPLAKTARLQPPQTVPQ